MMDIGFVDRYKGYLIVLPAFLYILILLFLTFLGTYGFIGVGFFEKILPSFALIKAMPDLYILSCIISTVIFYGTIILLIYYEIISWCLIIYQVYLSKNNEHIKRWKKSTENFLNFKTVSALIFANTLCLFSLKYAYFGNEISSTIELFKMAFSIGIFIPTILMINNCFLVIVAINFTDY